MLYALFGTNVLVVNKIVSETKRIGISQQAMEADADFLDMGDAVFFEVATASKEERNNSCLMPGNMKHFPKDPIVVNPARLIRLLDLIGTNQESSDHLEEQ